MTLEDRGNLPPELVEALSNNNDVKQVLMQREMRTNFDEYADGINFRSIPDVRDGLKQGARATLYAGYKGGIYGKAKPSILAAKLIGLTMGDYYPHGDSGIYTGITSMAHVRSEGKPYRNHLPMIDASGNWGSLDDSAAAYRYTKCQVSEHGMAMMGYAPDVTGASSVEINENTVPMFPNYLGVSMQPHDVLPAILPSFLINAQDGIGVGKSTSTAPHCLNEVLDAAYYMVKHPNLTIEKLRTFIPGPDVPADCDIYDSHTYSDINSYFETGTGSFVMRGRYEIEPYEQKIGSGRKAETVTRHKIIVTGLPYLVSPSNFIGSMLTAIEKDNLQESLDVSNRSGVRGVKVIIDCLDNDVDDVLLRLLAYTKLQVTFSVYAEAIIDNMIRRVGVKEAINQWLDHRRSVIQSRSQFRKGKYSKRLEIVEGFLLAIPNSSAIVELIRSADGKEDAIDKLMASQWQFSENQAAAIMELTMTQITKMGVDRYENEQASLTARIDECNKILADIDTQLRKEIKLTKKHFGIERRSNIVLDSFATVDAPTGSANPIPETDGIIVKTNKDWVRWVQRSNVKPFISDGNYITQKFNVTDMQTIEAVSIYGWLYRESCGDVPGKMTNSFMFFNGLEGGEDLVMVAPHRSYMYDDNGVDIVMVTSINGREPGIRRIAYDTWTRQRLSEGKSMMTLQDGERVDHAFFLQPTQDILLVTADGMALRMDNDTIAARGRTARSVSAMKLNEHEDDRIVFAGGVYNDERLVYIDMDGRIGSVDTNKIAVSGRNTKGHRITRVGSWLKTAMVSGWPDTDQLCYYENNGSNENHEVISVSELPEAANLTNTTTHHFEPETELDNVTFWIAPGNS